MLIDTIIRGLQRDKLDYRHVTNPIIATSARRDAALDVIRSDTSAKNVTFFDHQRSNTGSVPHRRVDALSTA